MSECSQIRKEVDTDVDASCLKAVNKAKKLMKDLGLSAKEALDVLELCDDQRTKVMEELLK